MSKNTITISIANAKGGIGKTTISTNISHILAMAGYKVLHVDLDPQGSGSELLRPLNKDGEELSRNDIISLDIFKVLALPANVRDYIFETRYENLDIIPNARSVSESMSVGSFDSRFTVLDYPNKFLAFSFNLDQVRGEYDYIIIDGQPAMNHIMKIGFIASDAVLTPAAPDIFNLRTVDETCNVIDICNKEYNLDIQYLGFFLNNVADVKDKNYNDVKEFYVQHCKEYFIDIPVRFSKAVNNASKGLELWLEYAFGRTVTFPNPFKDLLKILYSLEILDDEHRANLEKLGVNPKAFDVKE